MGALTGQSKGLTSSPDNFACFKVVEMAER